MLTQPYRTIAYCGAINALCYLFGFLVLFTLLTNIPSMPLEQLAFLQQHQHMYQLWHLVIYILFGFSLLMLVVGLYNLAGTHLAIFNQVISLIGVFWACLVITSGLLAIIGLNTALSVMETSAPNANQLWLCIHTIKEALGGGTEIVGGLWIAGINLINRHHEKWDKGLLIVGVIAGISGVLTIIPALQLLGAFFGLLQIAWFIHLSITFFNMKKAPEGAL